MFIQPIIVLLAFTSSLVTAQSANVTTTVLEHNNTSAPTGLQQQPIDKPVGLPVVKWDILRIEYTSRENLCQRQTAYCSTNCGGPSEAPKNFCNITSMAWGCGCSRKAPDFTPFLWPVVQAECSGKLQDCQLLCNNDKVNPSTCATICNAYYQCGTDKAPPSYLQVENPTDIPSYDGPSSTGLKGANAIVNGTVSSQSAHITHIQSVYVGATLAMAVKLLF